MEDAVDLVRQFAVRQNAGTARIFCPLCAKERKNKHDRTCTVTVQDGGFMFNCFHCGQSGAGRLQAPQVSFKQPRPEPVQARTLDVFGLTADGAKYLKSRGIDPDVAQKFGVMSANRYFAKAGTTLPCLAFTRKVDGEVVSAKFRTIDDSKLFTSFGPQDVYWGLEYAVEQEGPVVITEGELDALSGQCVGLRAISVPTGAAIRRPGSAGSPSPRGFNLHGRDGDVAASPSSSYVLSGEPLYNSAGKVVLATDTDEPGRLLADELARRIGKYRCWYVDLPADCKDCNDVLVRHGPDALRKIIGQARPWPVAGLYDALHYSERVRRLYAIGSPTGICTGISDPVDQLYSVVPGQVSIVTGVPSSGKSEVVDQIAVNLANRVDWHFTIASFENPPDLHIQKLLEKQVGKPFLEGGRQRISNEELDEGMLWVDKHFSFIEQADGAPSTIESILERAKAAVMRNGAKGLIIDPYNYLDRDLSVSETEYVSQTLTQIRRFALGHDAHVWFVAHPAKLHRVDGGGIPIPSGYDILGSSHWFNKADFGLTIHRNYEAKITVFRVWKCRFKWMGCTGDAHLRYELGSGRYTHAGAQPGYPDVDVIGRGTGVKKAKEGSRPDRYWYD